MKVVVAHVSYRHRGGEDVVVEREIRLLREAGVDVSPVVLPSEDFDSLPAAKKAGLALGLGDHAYGRSLMRQALEAHSPDVVHAHNLYPLLGIGALREAAEQGVGTVHTWHNYRTSCIAGTHLYRGHRCTDCSIESRRAGCVRGCYRGSRLQSVSYARAMGDQVSALRAGVPDRVVCLTEFQRDWFVGQGLSAERLVLKPNSVAEDVGAPFSARSGALYVGRLSPEKGIERLASAWPASGTRLDVVGAGPLADAVQRAGAGNPSVRIAGELPPAEVREAMRSARVLVVPSLCFEALPMVVVEALACGTPVLTFTGGSVERIPSVMSVPYGDMRAFAEKALSVCESSEREWSEMSASATSAHAAHFSDTRNVGALLEVYRSVLREVNHGRAQ